MQAFFLGPYGVGRGDSYLNFYLDILEPPYQKYQKKLPMKKYACVGQWEVWLTHQPKASDRPPPQKKNINPAMRSLESWFSLNEIMW